MIFLLNESLSGYCYFPFSYQDRINQPILKGIPQGALTFFEATLTFITKNVKRTFVLLSTYLSTFPPQRASYLRDRVDGPKNSKVIPWRDNMPITGVPTMPSNGRKGMFFMGVLGCVIIVA